MEYRVLFLVILVTSASLVAAQGLTQTSSNYTSAPRETPVSAYTSGLVFIAGGSRGGGPTADVDIYNTGTGTWSISSLSVPRGRLAAVGTATKAIFAGGSNGGANGDVVDIYHAANSSWTTATLSAPRAFLEGAATQNIAIFGGGVVPFISQFTPLNVADIYDISTNTWTTHALSEARAFLGATATANTILFAGGQTASGSSAVVDIYHLRNSSWTTATLSVARHGLRGAATSKLAFFAGGYTSGQDVVDIFNEETGAWTTATLSTGRGFMGAAANEDFVIFAGGYTITGEEPRVADIYNVSSGVWSTAGTLTTAATTGAASPSALFFSGDFRTSVVDIFTVTPGISNTLAPPSSGTTTPSPTPPATTLAPPPPPPPPSADVTFVMRAPSRSRTTAGPVWRSLRLGVTTDSLLISFTSYNSFNLSGAPRYSYPRINFFFDLDNTAASGYAVQPEIGSEFLLQGTSMFRQAAGTFNAGYVGQATASCGINVSECTLTVPLSALRGVNAQLSTVRIVGLNDETFEFIPPADSYLSLQI